MGRKRKSGKPKAGIQNDGEDSFGKMAVPNPTSEEYFYDEIEQHALKKDKILLEDGVDADARDSDEYSDEGVEVLQLDANQSSDDEDLDAEDEENDIDEDEEDSENDEDPEAGLPSSKAWGRKKSQFYDTDIKDMDKIGSTEEDQLAAEEEEKEALSLQQRMMSHLSQEDFDHFDIEVQPAEDQEESTEMEDESHVRKDLSELSKEEMIQILVKDSPEIFELMDDYQSKMSEVINKYHPLLLLARNDDVMSPEGKEFVEIMHPLFLNYCVTISFYLALKAKNENVKDHPVIEKLVEYRNLISQFEPTAKKFEGEMEEILANSKSKTDKATGAIQIGNRDKDLQQSFDKPKSQDSVKVEAKSKKKKNKIIKQKKKDSSESQVKIDPLEYYNKIANEIKMKKIKKKKEHEVDLDADEYIDPENEDEAKRAITYEMQKNKGMTRKRKKELNNPRVKHKMKFKKAIVRRKSQIPMARKEAGAYGGELTGIKSNLTKSVKIK